MKPRSAARQWFGPPGLFALLLPVLGACAEERSPINRVQPNALEKSFFVGPNLASISDDPEFYSAATVIDVPYGVDHGLFSGMAGGLKRLKWEIAEDQLMARATYETYEGVDGRGSQRTNDGQVIAAFPITSHFDIRRSYNPSTGEELNVVEENTSDRPWYEREFFRVDWSLNLVTSSIWWDPLAQNAAFDGANYGVEPLAYYVNDPANPDAPVFALGDGYFDVTQKVFVTPRNLEIDGLRRPTCMWRGAWVASGTSEVGVCEASEIKVRLSFKQVRKDGEPGFHEYEPMHWDGARMEAFGVFTQDRKGYDNHYGIVDEGWYRFAQRYNIWRESFARNADGVIGCGASGPYDPSLDPGRDERGARTRQNPDGTLGPDGTDDECEAAPAGSQCNPVAGACTLPYALREVFTVAWHHHMSNDDAVIVEQSKRATEEWDTALRIAVQVARQAECRRTAGASTRGSLFETQFGAELEAAGQDPTAACENTFFVGQGEEEELVNVRERNRCWDRFGRGSGRCEDVEGAAAVEPVIAFCHNPVRGPERDANGLLVDAGDHPACGAPGTRTRPGDIRYHSINIWPSPENSSPWGFGPSWADPLTGEIIQASINVYGAVTDERAQRIVDRTRWYAGELPTADVLSGQYVRDRVRNGAVADSTAGGSFLMTKDEVDRRLLGMRHADAESFANAPALRGRNGGLRGIEALRAGLAQNLAPPPVGGANRAAFEARIAAVKDSPLEAQLVGPMWFDAVGVNPVQASSGGLDAASPLRGANVQKQLDFEDAVQRRLAQNGICLYEADAPEPSSVPALVKLFERKFPDEPGASRVERIWNYVRGKMHYGVLLHEMGHTIGLRHNFTSSFDKFNYRPQYWQLRTKDSAGGRVTTLCEDATTDPTGEECIGPRYYDPLTADEIDNSLYTWAQTTVMDYSGDLTHDWLGLGIYDYAAARMFYGDVVDVRRDLTYACGPRGCSAQSDRAFWANQNVGFPGFIVPQYVAVPTTADAFRVLHYTEWNDYFPLVGGCRAATPEELAQPPDWNEAENGIWDPVFDGEVVHNEVCARPPVSFYSWRELLPDVDTANATADSRYYTPRRAVTKPDSNGTSYVRVPYSFLSDEYSDGWSVSALTRDAGADAYEQATWFINQYENGHIWNNFRNGRTGFSIVDSYRTDLQRYHMKLANLAQGLSIFHDYYLGEIAKNEGTSHAAKIAEYEAEGGYMREQAVAAGLVFDHFLRVLTRPQAGIHYTLRGGGNMFLAGEDRVGATPSRNEIVLTIPNGTTLLGTDVTFGGRPLNNDYAPGQGYWYYDYLSQAGSYYEKTYAFDMMLNATYRAPSAFTRWDGIDGRWLYTNFFNLFPEGMRRLMGVMLTEDYELVAPRVTANNGIPDRTEPDALGLSYPLNPIAWASFVSKSGPEHCSPTGGNYVCRDTLSNELYGNAPLSTVAVEPQLGFEIQKFLAFWGYVHLPESQVFDFVDMMRIWKIGEDVDPAIADQYVAWIDPQTNIRYYARRFGEEAIFGKTYDKGIAAKMLEWANELTRRAYVVDAVDPLTGAVSVLRNADRTPIIADDPTTVPSNSPLECSDNRYCQQLRDYRGLIDFVRDLGHQVGFREPELPTIEY